MERLSANPRGTNLARFVQALGTSGGNTKNAALDAEARWKDSPAVALTLRAYVPAMSTTGAGSPLMTYGIAAELVEALRGATIVGRLQTFMRHVPFATNIARETTGASSAWVGEGQATPATPLAYDSIQIPFYKTGTMIIFSKELMKLSTPSAEASIRTSLIKGVSSYLDAQFLDAAVTLIAGVRPASITNGAPTVTSTGSTAAQITTDLTAMLAALTSFAEPFWVMRTTTAIALAGKTNASGNLQFPFITAKGGSLLGVPVLTSTNSPAAITLLDAAEILIADEGEAELSLSEEASVLLDDSPETSPMTSELVSLWGRNLVAIKCLRYQSWLRAHTGAAVSMQVSY